ncbi:MAG TPA: hypothetical protein PK022_06510, partial [Syntrophales bacterium]|nr:hypothetical protein [Syntrophales bacterium]
YGGFHGKDARQYFRRPAFFREARDTIILPPGRILKTLCFLRCEFMERDEKNGVFDNQDFRDVTNLFKADRVIVAKARNLSDFLIRPIYCRIELRPRS